MLRMFFGSWMGRGIGEHVINQRNIHINGLGKFIPNSLGRSLLKKKKDLARLAHNAKVRKYMAKRRKDESKPI
jgi:hypothetical protein